MLEKYTKGEMQVLLHVQTAIDSLGEASGVEDIDWVALEENMVRRHFQPAEDIASLIKFGKQWGGGVGCKFIEYLHRLHQALVPANRVVPTQTFEALTKLKLKVDELCPFFSLWRLSKPRLCVLKAK